MHDLIIIGGGPAAAAAAVYALAKQLDFLVIYAEPGKAGSRQLLAGPNEREFLPGADAVLVFEREVLVQAGRTLRDRVTEVSRTAGTFDVMTQHHGLKHSAALIVATGATPIPLEVPGARALLGYGLGYSITTHAHILAGKNVAVVGTTVRALSGVAELARSAAQVYLIARDSAGTDTPLARGLRRHSNVEILEGYEVQEVVGAQSVEQIVVARDGQARRLEVDAAFVDLGLLPNSGIVRRMAQTDEDGFIWEDDRNATTQPGLFAAGDVTSAFGEQIMIAIGDGARAALSAYQYLLSWWPDQTAGPLD
jgi:thioredoxin reductase